MKKHMLVKKLDSHETIFYFLSVVNPPMRRVEPDTSAVCSRFFGLAKKHREAPGTTILISWSYFSNFQAFIIVIIILEGWV